MVSSLVCTTVTISARKPPALGKVNHIVMVPTSDLDAAGMQAVPVSHPQTLHEVKVEGQWKKMVREDHPHEMTPVLKGADQTTQQPFGSAKR